jgi:hypothetical protein
MKAYGGVDILIHIFLTSALVGGELSASCNLVGEYKCFGGAYSLYLQSSSVKICSSEMLAFTY